MLNVRIVGPTGYVGNSACEQLFLAGNREIFRLVASQSAGYYLAAKDILPMVGNVHNEEAVLHVVRQGNIDIIVDTSSFNGMITKQSISKAVFAAG